MAPQPVLDEVEARHARCFFTYLAEDLALTARWHLLFLIGAFPSVGGKRPLQPIAPKAGGQPGGTFGAGFHGFFPESETLTVLIGPGKASRSLQGNEHLLERGRTSALSTVWREMASTAKPNVAQQQRGGCWRGEPGGDRRRSEFSRCPLRHQSDQAGGAVR